MYLHDQTDARRLRAANAPNVHRFGRAADWLLSIAFAALLGTAVWKLDNDAAAAPVAPDAVPASAETSLARSKAAVVDMTAHLFGRRRTAHALGPQQSAPEGWAMWSGDAGRPRQLADCPRSRPDTPSAC